MPTYDFRCRRCGLQYEATLRIAELSTAKCIGCGGVCVDQVHLTPPYIASFSRSSKGGQTVVNPTPRRAGLQIENARIINCQTGMKLNAAEVKGQNVYIKDCNTAIDAKDSCVNIKNLEIE